METNPEQMYEYPQRDQFDNKENVILRSIVGDPNRHQPLAEHPPSRSISTQEIQPSSMYTRDTQYQTIPSKALPKNTEPRVYYVGSKQTEEPPMTKQDQETPFYDDPEKYSPTPTVFLEPRVISQPILFSIVGSKTTPVVVPSIPINQQQQPSPALFSITGRPRRPTVDMSVNNLEVATPVIDKSPSFYTVVGTPRLQHHIQELNKQHYIQEPTKQVVPPSPYLYSVVGSPARTSRGTQVNTDQPAPILYTIVNDTRTPKNQAKENHVPVTVRKQPNDMPIYSLHNEPNVVQTQQQRSGYKPTLYTLVDRPYSPPQDIIVTRTRPPEQKKTPPTTTIVPTRRISRSLERKPESKAEEVVLYPSTKTKHRSQSKEKQIPKSETVLVPLREEERRPRPQLLAINTAYEQTPRKPYNIAHYQPLQLADYRSPYEFRTQKPFREKKYNNDPFPIISNNNHSGRKERPALYEPRYRVERHHAHTPLKPTSLERNPVDTKPRPGLWEGYQTQTDDDEEYEQRINKKKQSYKQHHSRSPWIPVW